ncbi:MAG: outer membrane protein assembly factor BamD [Endozoicomonas sp.]
MKTAFFRSIAVTLAALILTGCASSGSSTEEQLPESLSEADLYQVARKSIDDERYSEAVKSLRALESRYPFGAFSEQAQLDIIYTYFQSIEPEASKAAADRFIRLHPQHPDVDYAYYMKGLASHTASLGLLERYLPLDLTRRDPGDARVSFNEFSELLNRFPESKYAADARQRMVALRNRLAEYEVHAANFYLKRKEYVAAIKRGQYVVENMQKTPAVPEALSIMIEGYQHLALTQPASEALAVLKLNYPDHSSLDAQGNFIGYKVFDDVDPSIWSTLTFGLIGGSEKQQSSLAIPLPPQTD